MKSGSQLHLWPNMTQLPLKGEITMLNDVQNKFKELRLKHCSENIEILLEQAKEKNLSTLQVIDRLMPLRLNNGTVQK